MNEDTPVLGYVRRPRTPEELAEKMAAVLHEARRLAVLHRDEMVNYGFSQDDANHAATGALYDIQSAMLGAL